jgi:hypothetical protein
MPASLALAWVSVTSLKQTANTTLLSARPSQPSYLYEADFGPKYSTHCLIA